MILIYVVMPERKSKKKQFVTTMLDKKMKLNIDNSFFQNLIANLSPCSIEMWHIIVG
jgi:NADH:ubiquinone oxidoreductase subunit B-like Fe-S oxidoreductase